MGEFKREMATFKGDIQERALREAVEKRYGRDFSELFCIEGLNGLARVIGTRKTEYRPRPHDEPTDARSDTQMIESASACLVASLQVPRCGTAVLAPTHAYTQDDAFGRCLDWVLRQCRQQTWLCDQANVRRIARATFRTAWQLKTPKDTLHFLSTGLHTKGGRLGALLREIDDYLKCGSYLLHAFCDYVNCDDDARRSAMLRNDSGLGLMIFCDTALHPHETILREVHAIDQKEHDMKEPFTAPPIHVLELDCRGSSDCGRPFVIRIGEIKSSQPRLLQMLRAMIVLKAARTAVPFTLDGVGTTLQNDEVVVYGVTFLPRHSRYRRRTWHHAQLPGIVLRFEML